MVLSVLGCLKMALGCENGTGFLGICIVVNLLAYVDATVNGSQQAI